MNIKLLAIAAVGLALAGCQSVPAARNGKQQPAEAGKGASPRGPEAPANVARYAGTTESTWSPQADEWDSDDPAPADDDNAGNDSGRARPTAADLRGFHMILVASRAREIQNLASGSQP